MPVTEQKNRPDTILPELQNTDPVCLEKVGEFPLDANADQTLGQIVAGDVRRAEIFNKYGIDFCCGGKKTLKEACAEKKLDAVEIERELQAVNGSFGMRELPYNEWKPGFLADYIVNTHHSYVKKALPELSSLSVKVVSAHGKLHPELLKIKQLVEDISQELSAHMMKEEKILFPYIKQLDAVTDPEPVKPPVFGTVQNPIAMMETEHEDVGKKLEEIRKLSNNYSLPEDACASYNLLYKMLVGFEADLHIHIHLENNILFPKALQLEIKARNL